VVQFWTFLNKIAGIPAFLCGSKQSRTEIKTLVRWANLDVKGDGRIGEVDGAELDVLEVEGGLGWVEGEVYDEHDEADDDSEREEACGDGAAAPPEDPVVVLLALAHGDQLAGLSVCVLQSESSLATRRV
jgi:hypothetical protein